MLKRVKLNLIKEVRECPTQCVYIILDCVGIGQCRTQTYIILIIYLNINMRQHSETPV